MSGAGADFSYLYFIQPQLTFGVKKDKILSRESKLKGFQKLGGRSRPEKDRLRNTVDPNISTIIYILPLGSRSRYFGLFGQAHDNIRLIVATN